VDEFKPDIIIGTHMFQPIGLTRLKDKGKLNVPFYSIVTDYTVYPLTEYGQGVEKIIIPSEDLRAGHMRLGYRNDQIVALGFPVRLERPAERPNRGRGKLHVTIMSGPGRMKRIDREIKELLAADLDIHVSIMNGKDERHRRKIEGMISKARPKRTVVNNCGFVDDATYERILNDSDILVTKCGGNTLSEAIKLGKVVITSSEQVGQELDNLNFFKERIPIFQTEKGKGIADILRENNFDDAFLDRYWSMTEGIVPAEGYKAYVDLFWGEMQP
jgi:processive 1,2-diacylglycerol beta-glucosyltransferase